MLLIGLREGQERMPDGSRCATRCNASCPWYTETGIVRGYGGPLRTHCSMTMHPWMADCDIYDARHIDKIEVTEDEWVRMQQAIGRRAKRQTKLYPETHQTIHSPGCEWTRKKGLHNATKSK